MAYDYLGLVNDVNARLNEVQLTSANFATATGFYQQAKEAVNSSIRFINQREYKWPFNHVTQEDTLTDDETRYAFPSDTKTVDMDSFRIKANDTFNNETKKLKIMSYENYLENFINQEYEDNVNYGLPRYVFRTPDDQYGVSPKPDNAYELVYEYYRIPVDLINATDVPSIPERFRHVVVDGAMYYSYLFRSNTQDATVMQNKFDEGIDNMRKVLINRYDYVRSTYIMRSGTQGNYIGRL